MCVCDCCRYYYRKVCLSALNGLVRSFRWCGKSKVDGDSGWEREQERKFKMNMAKHHSICVLRLFMDVHAILLNKNIHFWCDAVEIRKKVTATKKLLSDLLKMAKKRVKSICSRRSIFDTIINTYYTEIFLYYIGNCSRNYLFFFAALFQLLLLSRFTFCMFRHV